MAWYSSWIPSLPSLNLSIPSSIQSRFISFVLKKALGHLLKPGQLDLHQIDSQIGSGYVQISDLELDAEAINCYLEGLPIALVDGQLSSVKARIPWPNPLASTLGFSLSSLHLTFNFTPSLVSQNHRDIALSNSVTLAAETFFHTELSPNEEDALWKSYHADASDIPKDTRHYDFALPGGLDTAGKTFTDPQHLDLDPKGVSLFATLIERLLARFEFDAHDVQITLVHPNNTSITMKLDSIRYLTDSTDTDCQLFRESRSVTLDGLRFDMQNLSPSPALSDVFPTPASPKTMSPPPSPTSSIDDDTTFDMSQSLAFLPPRTPSPTDSAIGSSMYESAISTQSILEENIISTDSKPAEYDSHETNAPGTPNPSTTQPVTILSFGGQNVVLRLTTPSAATSSENPFESPDDSNPDGLLHLAISAGVISSVVRPWHLHALSRLSEEWLSLQHRQKTPNIEAHNPSLPSLQASVTCRGLVAIICPTDAEGSIPSAVSAFYQKPLVPPPFDRGYTRLHLESLTAELTILSSEIAEPRNGRVEPTISYDCKIADLSVFAVGPGATSDASSMPRVPRFFPLLITDPCLSTQYDSVHIHPQDDQPYPRLPQFHVEDWTQSKYYDLGARLSKWRTAGGRQDPDQLSAQTNSFALSVLGRRWLDRSSPNTQLSESIKVQVAPLHTRVDLESVLHGSLISFVDEFLEIQGRCRCSRLQMSDMTVQEDHQKQFTKSEAHPVAQSPLGPSDACARRWSVEIPHLRFSIRCPSPLRHGNRSGSLVLDIRGITMSSKGEMPKPAARFVAPQASAAAPIDRKDGEVLMQLDFTQILVSSCPTGQVTATGFLSIGPLLAEHDTFQDKQEKALNPRLSLIRPQRKGSASSTITALAMDVPSLHLDLTKPCFDGLQYLVDDITQFIEQSSEPKPHSGALDDDDRNTSMIGSRFFAKSRGGSTVMSDTSPEVNAETVIKLKLNEARIRILLPRAVEGQAVSPFNIKASDLDALIELNPENKQRTVVTLGIMDLAIQNSISNYDAQTFLDLTAPRSLASIPKPMMKLRFSSSLIPETGTKESRIKLTMHGFTFNVYPQIHWVNDLTTFMKNPPGTFESVIPTDHTRVVVKLSDASIRVYAPCHPGSLVVHSDEFNFSTDVAGDSRDAAFYISASGLSLLGLDNLGDIDSDRQSTPLRGNSYWAVSGFALVVDIPELLMCIVNHPASHPDWKVAIDRIVLRLHLCADTMSSIGAFSQDFSSLFKSPDGEPLPTTKAPPVVTQQKTGSTLMSSVEDLAFKRLPEVGPAPDMIYDDLPTNLDYLDESFGTAAGLRELRDDDLDDFEEDVGPQVSAPGDVGTISRVRGETIKIFEPLGFEVIEDYFLTIPPDVTQGRPSLGDAEFSLRIKDSDVTLLLYDGYDWAKTRRTIEEEVKEMRKRLAKIRQLVATGQLQDPSLENTSAVLFNSVYIGLEQDEDVLGEPATLIAAIDEELRDDYETGSQSSWQSLRPSATSVKPRTRSALVHGKRLTRAKHPSMEFCLSGLRAEFDKFQPADQLVSRTFVVIKDLEILDHIKTSTWKKFLTELRSDSRGNIRETDSNMVRVELRGVRPVAGHSSEEVRLRAKILPLRLYVDQDAVDFLKKFFSFKNPDTENNADPQSDSNEAYIQLAEIFPIDLKLDYKPRRVDYRALKEGRTIELMNFFHFDGAEMTLRHITLAGVTGWARMFEMLNDLWTPDVKATQLVEVISGVAPIRSIVNVGSGVADLILLPIAQYKKDGRIVRGVQKGATAFVKSTAIEAIKMGAKLATGTQVILEQAEGVLGGNFETVVTEEGPQQSIDELDSEDPESLELISKYAQQPADLKEGVQSAYRSLQRNLSSAAQTILAVPMEVYERSGNEGPVRAVIRAVPIAVLKPMIGASEAVSKTLQGLHNTLDPNVRRENEAKYK